MQPTEDTESGTWRSEVARWAGAPQVGTALRTNALGLSRWGKHCETRAGETRFPLARSRTPDQPTKTVKKERVLGLGRPAGSESDYFLALGLGEGIFSLRASAFSGVKWGLL